MSTGGQRATDPPGRARVSRRAFLGTAGGAAVGAAAAVAGMDLADDHTGRRALDATEPFYGLRQGGILTAAQRHTYFAALTVTTQRRSELADLLRAWTASAARMAAGRTAEPLSTDATDSQPDSGESLGLGPARLTVTVGFGPGLFVSDGVDRFGLAARRPAALVELPGFPGDQLLPGKVGGDLTLQACADDPQVAFHAVRQLVRQATGVAQVAWTQAGFNESAASSGVPRNLMGFKDGILNPQGSQLDRYVWVGPEGPAWMRAGSYLVVRRIRIALEHWDAASLDTQEQVIGRHKLSGAPLGQTSATAPLDLTATDAQGSPLIPLDSHVRLSSPQANGGRMILRRGYAYNDGVDPFDERWPPWQRALLYDAGLLFFAYQRDPRSGFIPLFSALAEADALSQFTTHTGSAIAAVPPAAAAPGQWIGQQLLEA